MGSRHTPPLTLFSNCLDRIEWAKVFDFYSFKIRTNLRLPTLPFA